MEKYNKWLISDQEWFYLLQRFAQKKIGKEYLDLYLLLRGVWLERNLSGKGYSAIDDYMSAKSVHDVGFDEMVSFKEFYIADNLWDLPHYSKNKILKMINRLFELKLIWVEGKAQNLSYSIDKYTDTDGYDTFFTAIRYSKIEW